MLGCVWLVQELRGFGVDQVYAGEDYSFAITESSDIYAWGGGGKGPLAIPPLEDADDEDREITDEEREKGPAFMRPAFCNAFRGVRAHAVLHFRSSSGSGIVWLIKLTRRHSRLKFQEGIVQLSVQAAHCSAVSDGGDAYTWGSGRHGQLGHASSTEGYSGV